MSVTYGDYKDFGYSVIPEDEFARYSDMAEKTIKRYVKKFTYISGSADLIDLSKDNMRCICEVADILYAEHNQLNRQLAGFGNENYREQYFENNRLSLSEQIWEAIRLYFTHEELYRGV